MVAGKIREALFTVNRGRRKIWKALFTLKSVRRKIREALFTVNRGYIFTDSRALRGLPEGLITVDRASKVYLEDQSL